ncbi:MAG: autotransporter strand-loop-strand O-heptosyltransferase [Caulobacteraceae bacterium]
MQPATQVENNAHDEASSAHAGEVVSSATEPPSSTNTAESGAPSVTTSATAKPAYPPPAVAPTQKASGGIKFDFNLGARVVLPKRTEGEWRVCLRDLGTGNILFESKNQGAFVASSKRFFVRFRLEVFDGETSVLEHDYDCRGKKVLIQFPVGTLGDTLAWFPYAAKFQEKHGCKLTCAMSELIIPLLKDQYPEISFITHEEVVERKLAASFYATYSMGLFFDDKDCIWQPTDFRLVGLHRTAGYILGVDPAETAPKVSVSEPGRPIPEPYVCIAVQSSSGCKMWNNPTGWREVVAHLKDKGYRVICIDQKPVHGSGLLYTHIPHGAEDETGDRPGGVMARSSSRARARAPGVARSIASVRPSGNRRVMGRGRQEVRCRGPVRGRSMPGRPFQHTCQRSWLSRLLSSVA